MTDKINNYSHREIENGIVDVPSSRTQRSMAEMIKEAATAVAGQIYYSLSVADASYRLALASKEAVETAIGTSIKLQERQAKLAKINIAAMYVGAVTGAMGMGAAAASKGPAGLQIAHHVLDATGNAFKATIDGVKIPIIKAIAMYEAKLKIIEQETHLLTSSSTSLAEHMKDGFEAQMEWVKGLKELLRTIQETNVLRQIA